MCNFFLKNNFIYLFIFGCAGSLLLHGLSLVEVGGGYTLVEVGRFLIAVVSFCGAQAQYLWLEGLVAPQHTGSSWIRD